MPQIARQVWRTARPRLPTARPRHRIAPPVRPTARRVLHTVLRPQPTARLVLPTVPLALRTAPRRQPVRILPSLFSTPVSSDCQPEPECFGLGVVVPCQLCFCTSFAKPCWVCYADSPTSPAYSPTSPACESPYSPDNALSSTSVGILAYYIAFTHYCL